MTFQIMSLQNTTSSPIILVNLSANAILTASYDPIERTINTNAQYMSIAGWYQDKNYRFLQIQPNDFEKSLGMTSLCVVDISNESSVNPFTYTLEISSNKKGIPLCPNQCSKKGSCLSDSDYCHTCDFGYYGRDCSVLGEELIGNIKIENTIPPGEWKYYIAIIDEVIKKANQIAISIEQLNGSFNIYAKDRTVGQDYLPTQKLYTYFNNITSNMVSTIALPTNQYITYIVGIFNPTKSNTAIAIKLIYEGVSNESAFPLWAKVLVITSSIVGGVMLIYALIKLIFYKIAKVLQ